MRASGRAEESGHQVCVMREAHVMLVAVVPHPQQWAKRPLTYDPR